MHRPLTLMNYPTKVEPSTCTFMVLRQLHSIMAVSPAVEGKSSDGVEVAGMPCFKGGDSHGNLWLFACHQRSSCRFLGCVFSARYRLNSSTSAKDVSFPEWHVQCFFCCRFITWRVGRCVQRNPSVCSQQLQFHLLYRMLAAWSVD